MRNAAGYVLGVCNGFQVLTETGLLPGALMRNAGLKYICKTVRSARGDRQQPFTAAYEAGDADRDSDRASRRQLLSPMPTRWPRWKDEDRVAFRYATIPTGRRADIAGILSDNRRVLGMMPHPERAAEAGHGGTDGVALFRALAGPWCCRQRDLAESACASAA